MEAHAAISFSGDVGIVTLANLLLPVSVPQNAPLVLTSQARIAGYAGPARPGEVAMSRLEPAPFYFSGGCLCLDFANTRSWRPSAAPHERLAGFGDLVRWGEKARLLAPAEAGRLRAAAARRRGTPAAALREARALREAIYRTFSAMADGAAADGADAARLYAGLAGLLRGTRVTARSGAVAPEPPGGKRAAASVERLVLWPVLWSAARLLAAPELAHLRKCAAPNCGWLFVDTTRNRSRRWCDMRVCGNRDKVRRHRRRSGA
jgi:predicted RNA-binding Zn ribbon-like protein